MKVRDFKIGSMKDSITSVFASLAGLVMKTGGEVLEEKDMINNLNSQSGSPEIVTSDIIPDPQIGASEVVPYDPKPIYDYVLNLRATVVKGSVPIVHMSDVKDFVSYEKSRANNRIQIKCNSISKNVIKSLCAHLQNYARVKKFDIYRVQSCIDKLPDYFTYLDLQSCRVHNLSISIFGKIWHSICEEAVIVDAESVSEIVKTLEELSPLSDEYDSALKSLSELGACSETSKVQKAVSVFKNSNS